MGYTVEINKDSTIDNLSMPEAIEQAELYAADGETVFVHFFRDSDGQAGYLNRDGHSPVGRAW